MNTTFRNSPQVYLFLGTFYLANSQKYFWYVVALEKVEKRWMDTSLLVLCGSIML